MTALAAISAQLVDMRNVGTHKSLRLTLHVPEELALQAIEAFGWPTGANPVPVALARMNAGATPSPAMGERFEHSSRGAGDTSGQAPASRSNAGGSTPPVRGAESNPSPPPVAPASRSFSLAQRIGAICTKPIFHRFLADVHKDRWRFFTDHGNVCNSTDTDKAAEIVRSLCGVKSRADIETNPDALDRWVAVVDVFGQWQRENPF